MKNIGKWVVTRKKECLILVLLILLVIGIAAIAISRSGNGPQENENIYGSFDDALQAGADEGALGCPLSDRQDVDLYTPLCRYQRNGADYCVMYLPLEEEGDLAYSDNVYVMKIVSTEKGYTYEIVTPLCAIYMEDENGADVSGEDGVVMLADETNDYRIQVGKARGHTVIPTDPSHLICTNLKDGIPQNISDIFVLVYPWEDAVIDAPEFM